MQGLSGHHLLDMRRPLRQPLSHLIEVASLVVYPGHTGFVSRNVIENGLDDMRQDAQLCHSRCCGSTEVMETEVINAVERCFA